MISSLFYFSTPSSLHSRKKSDVFKKKFVIKFLFLIFPWEFEDIFVIALSCTLEVEEIKVLFYLYDFSHFWGINSMQVTEQLQHGMDLLGEKQEQGEKTCFEKIQRKKVFIICRIKVNLIISIRRAFCKQKISDTSSTRKSLLT